MTATYRRGSDSLAIKYALLLWTLAGPALLLWMVSTSGASFPVILAALGGPLFTGLSIWAGGVVVLSMLEIVCLLRAIARTTGVLN